VTGPSLLVAQPYRNQEFPVGVDFPVSGTAQGWSEPWPEPEPHSIDSVSVRVDTEPSVEADLAQTPDPALAVAFSATVRLNSPGEHQVTVRATDDTGESITEVVAIATTGTPHCRTGVEWENYPNTQDLFPNTPSLIPHSTCTPESLAGVVASVREAEAANKHVHAFGSKWSFSDCAFTSDYIIDTRQLAQELQTVQRALLPGQSPPRYYHVEAGITIRSLYNNLGGPFSRLGLALETMGGASGQTLAGAISTGTHGGDKDMAPLADSVVALHLVGAGGTQYWIEPSSGITDPELLKAHVVGDVDRQNIVYDDETFNACLVSLGCMGVIYAVVLRVREAYDLVETTVETTWQAFKESASTYLTDSSNRFLQVLLNPYTDANDENFCLLTTRSEAHPDTGPLVRPPSDVEAAVRRMVNSLPPDIRFYLNHRGVFDGVEDPNVPREQKLAKIVDGILRYTPDQRPVMVAHYGPILLTQWPTGTVRGSSYSVMDRGYGQVTPQSQPGHSIELHFEAMDEDGNLGFVDFIDTLIAAVNAATHTFFAGYVSLRFTGGPTRAYLGMQQWNQTCSVEISVVQGVQGLYELLSELFRMGFERGGLPHWGQELDLGVQGYGRLYPRYAQWRQVYAKMSNYFSARTFENELSSRWKITTPDGPSPASIASNALLLLEEKPPVPIASNALLLLEEKPPVPIASIELLLLDD
jgi:FAD/FMN-containing dehydrogenase